MLLIDGAHKSGSGWEDLVHENEDGLLGRELDSLSDHVNELPDGQILCRTRLVHVTKGEYRRSTCIRNGARQRAARRGATRRMAGAGVNTGSGNSLKVRGTSSCRWSGCPSYLLFRR